VLRANIAEMKTVSLRRVARCVNGGTPTADGENWGGDVPWATPVDLARVDGGALAASDRTLTSQGLRSGSALIPAGSLIVSTRAPIGYVARTAQATAFNQGCRGLIPNPGVDVRFLQYWLWSESPVLQARGTGSTFQELATDALMTSRVPARAPEEQRRIADFLDDQVARLDAAIALRENQRALLEHRLQNAVDRLPTLGADRVRASRILRVLPGYAFASDGFSDDPDDVRLLRGINVGVGVLRWDETVFWPADLVGEAGDFALTIGDVVTGMDRPWIGSGLRIAQVTEADVPALLLQRVALLRPGPLLDPRFMYWAYRTQAFRESVEAELTGLSVPHLSGPQIESFALPLPDLATQRSHAAQLDELDTRTREAAGEVDRSIALLRERKRALITAAVTGELDVTTASARAATT
jgi:type I restriction enzyme S subunit